MSETGLSFDKPTSRTVNCATDTLRIINHQGEAISMISHLIDRLYSLFEKLPLAVLKVRWLIIAIFIISTGFMLYSLVTRFNMDMSLETFFAESDPVRVTLNKYRQEFGSDDGLYIVYEAKDGDVFSETSIDTIARLHRELDDARVARGEQANELNRIESIDSLYNARLQKVEGDTLISQNLLATDFPTNAQQREAKRETALDQETFRLAYYSENFRFGGIRIKTDFGTIPKSDSEQDNNNEETQDLLSDDFAFDNFDSSASLSYDESLEEEAIVYEATQMFEYLAFMTAVKAITEKPEYQHFDFHYSGNAPMMEFTMETVTEGTLLMAGMMLMIVVLLFALFNSFSAVLWSVLVVAGSTIWALGFFTLLGVTLSNLINLTMMLILVVGIATCVHVLSTYIFYRRLNLDHEQAISTAYRQTGVPIVFTSITTIAGMLTLVASDIAQLSVFGLNSAFGVLIAFLMIMFVFPIFLDLWHPYKAGKQKEKAENIGNMVWLKPILEAVPAFTERHAKVIFAAFLAAFLCFVYGASVIKVNTNLTETTRSGSRIQVAAEIIDSHMMGGQNMEVILDFGKTNALKDPDVLKAIEGFQKHILDAYPEYVIKSFSLADYVKETNKAMNQDQESYKRIPDDPVMTAQLLYMFDNSNPEDRRNLVSDDYSKSHISIQLKNAGSYEYTDMFDSMDKDIEEYFGQFNQRYEDSHHDTTGALPLMMKLLDKLSWGQIKSFGLAFIIISIFLIIATGSFAGGAIAVLPNVLPAISTFGLMGLLGISLSSDTLVVAPVIIGIAVDDTIHFMSHYRDAWFRTGDIRESIKETVQEVGQAITFTSIILSMGFAVLAFSDFTGIAKIGAFGSFAIIIALVCVLFLLPALIYIFKPDLGRQAYLASLGKQPHTANH